MGIRKLKGVRAMCNVSTDVMDKLSKTVKQFLDEGRMFTGYDVTIATREREQMQLRHQDVNGAIHEVEELVDAMDFGHDSPSGQTVKWERTRRDVPGTSGAWAWIYHPQGVDPTGYQFRNQKQPAGLATGSLNAMVATATKAPALSFSTVNDGNTSDSGGEQDDGTFVTDYRNRLMIPTRLMRDAGMKAGDECYVLADNQSNSVIVFKATSGLTGVSYTVQKVEKDGEVRLSSKTLRAADLNDNKFVIEIGDRTFGTTGSNVKVVEIKKAK
jgi:hypothetical protein